MLKGAATTKPYKTAEGGKRGLPADFLVAPDGRIVACKFGKHANDQWSVDELLSLVSQHAASSPKPNEAYVRPNG